MNKALLAIASVPFLYSAAQAVPLTPGSTLSLDGTDSYTPTSVTFVNPANIGAQSGSFSVLANCTGCVTMTSFSSATATPFQLYTASEGAISTKLEVSTANFVFDPGGPGHLPSLEVNGEGILSLTGFDDTQGEYSLTTQGPDGETRVTFSVTSMATGVPEPASLAIIGSGLLGFAWLRRRRGSV